MAGSDGSTAGSMLLWAATEFDEDETIMFWLNIYRGFREIEGTADRYRFLTERGDPAPPGEGPRGRASR